MKDETHEGWTNAPTWAIALAIDNNAEMLGKVLRWARSPSITGQRGGLAGALARVISAYINKDEKTEGVFRNELLACLSGWVSETGSVPNWNELAEHYMTKAREGAVS